MENKLYGKKIIWNGDSICIGLVETGSWATRIAEKNSMTCKNYARGGGTITEGMPKVPSGADRHSVSLTLEKMYEEYPDADYIILEGGTNDADLLGNPSNPDVTDRLGSFKPFDFSGNYDVTTFCGAFESVIYRTLKYWPGKKVGYIVAQKMGTGWTSYSNRRFYFEKAIEICKKWGIPYIDLWTTCYINPNLPDMYDSSKTTEENEAGGVSYFRDSQHLTARGYDITAEMIETWLKTL